MKLEKVLTQDLDFNYVTYYINPIDNKIPIGLVCVYHSFTRGLLVRYYSKANGFKLNKYNGNRYIL